MDNTNHQIASYMHSQKELEKQIEKEIFDELQNGEDISDIIEQIPNDDKLNELKAIIDASNGHTVVQMMNVLVDHKNNTINPNKNEFSSVGYKEIMQFKLTQRKDMLDKFLIT